MYSYEASSIPQTGGPIACVHLPGLPLWAHHGTVGADATEPRAVHRGKGSSGRILWCDPSARAAGVGAGQTLAAARLRAPSLCSMEYAPELLTRAQHQVVERLLAVSPRIAIGGLRRFWAEPSSRERSPLEAWCERARETLSELHPMAIGVGPTATVAYAAARAVKRGVRVIPEEDVRDFLDEAPIEVLGIGGEALDILASLGIRRVRELRALDPISLGMRFGPAIAEARRRADGQDPRRPLTPRITPPDSVDLELDTSVEELDPLLFLLRPALGGLLDTLRSHDRGVTHLVLRLRFERRMSAPPPDRLLSLRTASPLDDPRAALELLRTHLEKERLSAPIRGFSLIAEESAPLRDRTRPLLGKGEAHDPAAREVALHRLRSRFGRESVKRAERVESPSPLERARFHLHPDGSRKGPGEAFPWQSPPEPLPIRRGKVFVEGRMRRVLRISRVERVTPNWWEDGVQRAAMIAWAELDGPMVALLNASVGDDCEDEWILVAYAD